MLDPAHQLLDTIITSLRTLDASDFAEIFTTFPQPYADYPGLDTSVSVPFHLPVVLVPPEIVELDGISSEASEEPKASSFKSRRIPIRQLDMLFDRRWRISSKSLRSTGKSAPVFCWNTWTWTLPGTFKPKPDEGDPVPGKDWQLEMTILEVCAVSHWS
jgi:nuclear cap-binding protein subunit 1